MVASILSRHLLHNHQPLWTLSGVDLLDPARKVSDAPDVFKSDILYLFYNAVDWVAQRKLTFDDPHSGTTQISLLPHYFISSPCGDKTTPGKGTVQGIHKTGMLTIRPDAKHFGVKDLPAQVPMPPLKKPVEVVLVKNGTRAYVHLQLSADPIEVAQFAIYLLIDPATFYAAVQKQFRINGSLVYTDAAGTVIDRISSGDATMPEVFIKPNSDHEMFFEGVQPPNAGTEACNADVGTYTEDDEDPANPPNPETVIVTVNSSFIKLY